MTIERDVHASGPDAELRQLLDGLDPEAADPGYWHRFQRRVLNAAAGELARRRRLLAPPPSVGDVVVSWWRTLVPTAVLAAAAAGLVLLQEPPAPSDASVAGVEDLLLAGLEGDPLPAILAEDGALSLASETF